MTVEVPKELLEKIYKLVESVKVDGKIRKGTNETTKAVEKSEAQLVIVAEDTTPKEIVLHLPILCEEKKIPYVQVPSKTELGAAAGLPVSTSALAIANPGDAKKQLLTVAKDIENLNKAESKGSEKPKEEPKQEEKPAETPKAEEVKEEKPAEKVEEAPTKEEKVEESKSEDPVEESNEPKANAEEELVEETKEEAPVEEKSEEAPAEEPKEEETPVEDTAEEEPKVEEKPAEETKE
jgi:large subunit ribosomal protein L7Ae